MGKPTRSPSANVARTPEDLLLSSAPPRHRLDGSRAKAGRAAVPRASSRSPDEVYQLKVTLLGIEPPIWRRILVSADSTLGQLHDVLQIVMGWTNSHLHEFRVGDDLVFGLPDPDREYPAGNELRTTLRQVAKQGSVILYLYDFGDSWEHEITVEQITPGDAGAAVPTCVDGQRRAPPEDCGGVSGYAHLLEVLTDPDDDEHADMVKWVGGSFDPERFDLAAVNADLRALAGLRGRPRLRGRH
jgi:hypothetical protein